MKKKITKKHLGKKVVLYSEHWGTTITGTIIKIERFLFTLDDNIIRPGVYCRDEFLITEVL